MLRFVSLLYFNKTFHIHNAVLQSPLTVLSGFTGGYLSILRHLVSEPLPRQTHYPSVTRWCQYFTPSSSSSTQTRSAAVLSPPLCWRPPPVIKPSVFITPRTSRSFPSPLSLDTATGSTAAASARVAASCSAAPQTAPPWCGARRQVR